jgi:hypothetical protein
MLAQLHDFNDTSGLIDYDETRHRLYRGDDKDNSWVVQTCTLKSEQQSKIEEDLRNFS